MSAPNIETKEIGVSFGVGQGRYENTEFVEGILKLKKISGSSTVYEKTGCWESKVLDMVDKFKEYDKIAINKTQFTNDLYKIETRTSDDGINFNEYIAITADGNILSPKKRYIQIKIILYAGTVEEEKTISKFSSPSEVDEWDSKFIEIDGVLKLKTAFNLSMDTDNNWTDEGTLLRLSIENTQFKRIDSIRLDS